MENPDPQPRALLHWSITHGANLVVIIVGAFIVVRAANIAIAHLQFKLARGRASTDLEWQRRAATLGAILTSLVGVSAAFIAILMVMRELNIDILPILTGAGIAGLAVQSLFETGLRMPANAMLFALLAAIVVHEPRKHS